MAHMYYHNVHQARISVCHECSAKCIKPWRLLIQLQVDQEQDGRLSR